MSVAFQLGLGLVGLYPVRTKYLDLSETGFYFSYGRDGC